MKNRILSLCLAIVVVLTIFPFYAFASEPKLIYLDISKGTIQMAAGSVFGYAPDGTTVNQYDKNATYVITGTSNSTNIIINGGAVTIMLDNCHIDLSKSDDGCAFILKSNSNLSLGVISDSSIKSGKNCAGIQVTANASINIIEPVTGKGGNLNIYGGENAAAIGSNKNLHSGNINIKYGTVSLYGGNNSSALGRSNGNSNSKSVLISGDNTIVNVYGKLTAIETAKLTVNLGATLSCQSISNNNTIQADAISISSSQVNAVAPGKGVAIYGDKISISNSVINAKSEGNTAIGKKKNGVKTSTTVTNSSVTVMSPDSFYSIDAMTLTVTKSEIFVLSGKMYTVYDSFVYLDKICTYQPKNPLTVDYTIPDDHTVIIPENTNLEIGEDGGLHEGNGKLIVKGSIYYTDTVDGTENGAPILDNFALIEDGNTTWYNSFADAFSDLKSTEAKSITLKMFSDGTISEALPDKNFTINLNGYNLKFGSTSIAKSREISLINTSYKLSYANSSDLTNYGKLYIGGYIETSFSVNNNGGILTFKGLSAEKKATGYYVEIENTNGGTLNLDCAHIFGDRAIVNNEGCIVNLTNGASFYSEVFFSPALTNYGTVNGNNFHASAYQVAIDNDGGTLNLKNGTISTHYGSALSTNGNAYIENCKVSTGTYGGSTGISGIGTLTIKDSDISLSTSEYRVGISFRGTLNVDNCNIHAGNGIILAEGTATITNSSVSGTYYQYGSAISNYVTCNMTIKNCELRGIETLSNGGTIAIYNSIIESSSFYGTGKEKAISNSGTLYCYDSTVNGASAAYEGSGTATFKDCSIKGFDFSWNYDPIDLYGYEATFYMNGGNVKLYNNTLPEGFYVVTDKECETKYTIKDLIADKYKLYKTDDNSGVELDDNTAMLDGIYYIEFDENQLPDFGASIAHINESNVTSEDIEAINAELSVVNEYNVEDYSEKTATKITKTKEKCNALLEIIASVKEAIEIINGFAKEITAEEATTDTIDEIENIVSKAGTLLNGNNLSPSERSDIETAKTKLEEIISELAERKASIESALEGSEEITNSKPTTDDEERIITLIADINTLLSQNLTDEETAKLNSAKSRLEEKVSELADRKTAIESALERSEEIENGKTTTDDEEEINTLITNIENLLELELTEEQRTKLQTAKANALTALESFKQERNKLAELKTNFQQVNRKRVNIFDKKYLENISKEIGLMISEGTLGGDDLDGAKRLKNEVDNLIELVQTPMFYGIIRIFWTIISMFKTIIL